MIFYKHFIGDYQRKTNRLSILEDGVYRRLLDEYYANESPLPLEKDACFRLVRAIKLDERKAVLKILSIYFSETPEGYVQDRASEQIAEFKEKSKKASRSSRKRWDANANAKEDASQIPDTRIRKDNSAREVSTANSKPPKWAVKKMRKAIGAAHERGVGGPEKTPAQFRQLVKKCCDEMGMDFYETTYQEAIK